MGSSGAVQLYWKAPVPFPYINNVSDLDGYTLHWRTGNATEQTLFIKGYIQNSELLSALIPGIEYTAYITSHSSTKGDSPLMSPTFTMKLPTGKYDSAKNIASSRDKLRGMRVSTRFKLTLQIFKIFWPLMHIFHGIRRFAFTSASLLLLLDWFYLSVVLE